MRLDVKMPDVNSKHTLEEKVEALTGYVVQLQNKLKHVLSNIDTDNMAAPVADVVTTAVKAKTGIEGYVSKGEYKSMIAQTEKALEVRVTKGNLIASINVSPGDIVIKADKISLNGYVSVNDYFKIDEDGKLLASAGQIGGLNIDAAGLYYGTKTAEVSPLMYFGADDLPKAVSIAGSTERKDWRFKIGNNSGFTANGDLFCNAGYFRGTTDASKINYDATNKLNGSAIVEHTVAELQMETAYGTLKTDMETVKQYFAGTLAVPSMNVTALKIGGSAINKSTVTIGGTPYQLLTWS